MQLLILTSKLTPLHRHYNNLLLFLLQFNLLPRYLITQISQLIIHIIDPYVQFLHLVHFLYNGAIEIGIFFHYCVYLLVSLSESLGVVEEGFLD